MMQEYIMNFPKQLEDALSIAQTFHLTLDKNPIHNVVITGMGGSGIGGTFAQEYASEYSPLPIVVNKSYHLPKFVNKHSLVIASSYSGNTEETLSCVEDALNSEAQIVAITSGGKLDQLCREKQLPVVRIPKGYPPRTCLGYSFIQVLNILSYFNLVPFSWKKGY
jgi:glucose/mannose-6-phosphate isomerase